MSDVATLIRGADVVTAAAGRERADVGIGSDGRIVSVEAPGGSAVAAGSVVDASGLIVLPGGIDLHVHINTWFGGTTTRDDFKSGTQAALFGGTTTIAQFAIPRPGETSLDAVTRTLAEARPDAVADFAVHGCMVRETFHESIAQLDQLLDAGVGTVKVFSAYTDVIGLSLPQIERLLRETAPRGITVFVHAETDALIRAGIEDVVGHGRTGPDGHAASRTPAAEADAVAAIAELAAKAAARVYFVHISSAESVAVLAACRAPDNGAHDRRLLAETCPHYLFLDGSVYDRDDGQRWICSPPIRGEEHREALWKAIRDDVIDTVSSDHNCFDLHQKGPQGTDFRQVPNGLPGIEHRLPLLIGAALEGRLTWARLAEISAGTAGRILNLDDRKGAVAVGRDADLVLVDPGGSTELGTGHMASDYSPYAGTHSAGRIVAVWRRGELVVDAASGEAGLTSAAVPGSGAPLQVRPVRAGVVR